MAKAKLMLDPVKITCLMADRCMNTSALAEASGVSLPACYQLLEPGHYVLTKTAGKIAAALGVQAADIIERG